MKTLEQTAFAQLTGTEYLRNHWDRPVARGAWQAAFGNLCLFCEDQMDFRRLKRIPKNRRRLQATVDHIDCRAFGGSEHVSNIQIICWRCNHAKSKAEMAVLGFMRVRPRPVKVA